MSDLENIDFVHFISKHSKSYVSQDEYLSRLAQYKSNIAKIHEFNTDYAGLASFLLNAN